MSEESADVIKQELDGHFDLRNEPYRDEFVEIGRWLSSKDNVVRGLEHLNGMMEVQLKGDKALVREALTYFDKRYDKGGKAALPKDDRFSKLLTNVLGEAETEYPLTVNDTGPVTIVRFLDTGEFLKVVQMGLHFKDPGAEVSHGEFTHRIQWYALKTAQVLKHPVGPVFRALGQGHYTNFACKGRPWSRSSACSSARTAEATPWGALFDRTTDDELHFMVSNPDDFRAPVNLNTWLTKGKEAKERVPLLSAFLIMRRRKRGFLMANWSLDVHDYLARKVYGRHRFKELEKAEKAAVVFELLVKGDFDPRLKGQKEQEQAKERCVGRDELYASEAERDEVWAAVWERFQKHQTVGHGILQKAPGGKAHQVRGGAADFAELKEGCYLTTAACRSLSLADDCAELTALRWFRDHVLLASDDGRREVAEYYATAPAIVAAIDGPGNAGDVYRDVYRDRIAPAAAAVYRRDFPTAHAIFRDLVSQMRRRYLTGRAGGGR
jgi:hypothetical protein